MKHSLAALLLASSLVACSDRTPQVITVAQPATDRTAVMTVTGSATLDVSPDCADLTMTLGADAARPGLAATTLAKQQERLVAALRELGLATSDLKISHVTLNPIYKDWPQLKVGTYRAELTITATTKNFDQIAAIMEAGANAGANAMSSRFRRSDLAALKREVRTKALEAARDKAKQTAQTLGIELGSVMSVAEAPAGMMWSAEYFPANFRATADAAGGAASGMGGSLQPLTLDVTVGFELVKTT